VARPLFRSWAHLHASLPPELALPPPAPPRPKTVAAAVGTASKERKQRPAPEMRATLADERPPQTVQTGAPTSAGAPCVDGAATADGLPRMHMASSASGHQHMALVFGREESGLTLSEVLCCTHCCAIPSGRIQPSLNLSHSVAVMLAQIFEQQQAAQGVLRHVRERSMHACIFERMHACCEYRPSTLSCMPSAGRPVQVAHARGRLSHRACMRTRAAARVARQ
jgi:tRNA C32,U32 (ribose-2'-O)-methylase TrmJ